MADEAVQFTDLNDLFGKALVKMFFEPVITGRDPQTGNAWYAPSGVALMAQELYRLEGSRILNEIKKDIDLEVLARIMADMVVKDLTKVPGRYDPENFYQKKLSERVLEIVAQQLGQRVVDQMDLQLSRKELPEETETIPPG